ncbi:uncharacterized protein J3D65DRAFT_620871 [Phyllosticta citribraziliensis]|uniref:Uncharacterized protein n=1 Tax=Phyllosticta citribraziliensis TaxID=989973 RepID=A0ABR1LS94_9PEZI
MSILSRTNPTQSAPRSLAKHVSHKAHQRHPLRALWRRRTEAGESRKGGKSSMRAELYSYFGGARRRVFSIKKMPSMWAFEGDAWAGFPSGPSSLAAFSRPQLQHHDDANETTTALYNSRHTWTSRERQWQASSSFVVAGDAPEAAASSSAACRRVL